MYFGQYLRTTATRLDTPCVRGTRVTEAMLLNESYHGQCFEQLVCQIMGVSEISSRIIMPQQEPLVMFSEHAGKKCLGFS